MTKRAWGSRDKRRRLAEIDSYNLMHMEVKQLLTFLKMKGALEVLSQIEHLKKRDQFIIAILQAEFEDRKELACNIRIT